MQGFGFGVSGTDYRQSIEGVRVVRFPGMRRITVGGYLFFETQVA